MDIRSAYDHWSRQYDTNANRTRDLEAVALREVLSAVPFQRVLEIGSGTGKNTAWLVERAEHITAVDLSEGMLAVAREKMREMLGQARHDNVRFVQADILQPWTFAEGAYDLITFSLVLEHIEAIAPVVEKAATCLAPGGHLYIGELHPFKQYAGTKARFETVEGTHAVNCFDHHVSDFTAAATSAGLALITLREFFDGEDRTAPPRILAMMFRK